MMDREKLIQRLMDKEYRDQFVSEHIDTGVPFQIRALRRQRKMSQEVLADKAGMKQARVSLMERPGNGKLTLTTLKRLASAFDVALIVRFVPFNELANWVTNLSEERLMAPSFEEDPGFEEVRVEQTVTRSTGDVGILGIMGKSDFPKESAFVARVAKETDRFRLGKYRKKFVVFSDPAPKTPEEALMQESKEERVLQET